MHAVQGVGVQQQQAAGQRVLGLTCCFPAANPALNFSMSILSTLVSPKCFCKTAVELHLPFL